MQLKEINNWKLIKCNSLAYLCVCVYIYIYIYMCVCVCVFVCVLKISKKTVHLVRNVSELELTSNTHNVMRAT